MATQYAFGQIVTSGLVLSLDAADKNSYPESGTVWTDLTGNSNNGTLTNGPVFNSANGGSIFTDGTNDWVSTPYSGSATGNYTFATWFKNDNYSEIKYPLVRGRDGAGSGWSLQLNVDTTGKPSAGVVYTVPSLVGTGSAGTSTLALDTWYYLTGVWSAGSFLRIYVNGNLENTLSLTGTTLRSSTSGFSIGSISTTIFTSGYNAVAQVYTRVLSTDEIVQNYNAQKSRFGL